MMKIGFDISQTGKNKAGCGYYAYSIANSIERVPSELEIWSYPNFGDFYYDSELQNNLPNGIAKNYFPLLSKFSEVTKFWNDNNLEMLLGEPDIIHSNNFWCPTQLKKTKLVYTLYDLSFIENPNWTTERNRIGCFEGVVRAACYADWIVAISENSKSHFLKVFPHFPEDRIKVIYPCTRYDAQGSINTFVKAKVDGLIAGEFWLSVGTIEPRKNQLNLVEAYASYLKRGGKPMPLVMAGGEGWLMSSFEERIKQLGVDAKVIRLGYVSDEELCWLYKNCFANIYTSFFEGFGLPVLEGMQFGAATIASNASSIPEICDGASILVDPYDVDDLAEVLYKLSMNESHRESLRGAAIIQKDNFSWEKSAQQMLDLYSVVYELPKRFSKS